MLARFFLPVISLCACLAITGGPAGAEPPASGTTSDVTTEVVQARFKEVEASSEHEEALRNRLLELYRKTLTSLETERANQASTETFEQARQTAGSEAGKLRDALEKRKTGDKPIEPDIYKDKPLADAEQDLLKQKADFAAIETKLNSFKDQLARESARPDEARTRLNAARQQIETLTAERAVSPPADQSPLLTEATRWYRQAQIRALNAEVTMLDQELLSQPMRLELLKAQRDTNAYNLKRVARRIELLEALVSSQRRSEVKEALAQAETMTDKLAGKHPVIQGLAKDNEASSEQLEALSKKLETAVSGDQEINDTAKRIEDEFRRAQTKLEVAGVSQALGRVLVEQRRRLPNIRGIQRKKNNREREIAATALLQIQLNEEISNLQDLDAYIDALTNQLAPEVAQGVRGDLLALATTRLNLLDQTSKLNNAYLRALGELDYAESRLINAVSKYDHFLAENLLWIRSGPVPNLDMLLSTPAQVIRFLSPVTWFNVLEALLGQINESVLPVTGILLIIILLVKRPALKKALAGSARKIIKPRSDRFSYSLQALGITLLLALPWPLLFGLIGWTLGNAADTDMFTQQFARGLILLAPALFYLNAFRQLCARDGLAEAHFRWPQKSTRALKQQISLLMLVFFPAAIVAITNSQQVPGNEGALSRIAYVVVMASLSYFFYRLFGPKKPVLEIEFQRHPDTVLARYRYLWLVLALVLPLMLVILSISGYLYTAGVLTGSLIDTLWLVLGFLVIQQMAVRWLVMARRKLDFEAALERRRAALAAATEPPRDDGGEVAEPEEPEIDLKALNEESKKLLNSAIVFGALIGLWYIWADVLPAFGLFEKITLWHYTGTVDGEESQIPITLADIILSLIILLVTVVASKRFPALLEIVLLNRFSFTSGGRYAATTLSSYVIAAIGILLTLNSLGASWSQVQWLAAALSVGIGFGLQEIVANFISGIIILFERPIRVGDVVTIGDVDGTVTRIQIRATTIRTWDRQELLVPNKEFITGRLLNWSLSDQTTRIRVPVGVAYGSDVAKATALMNEAAVEHPLVLNDPPPSIIFDAFGDNTLNLELRCFVGTQDDRMPVRTRLHEMINDKFNENGIVIAFPQRDVHLDTARPLDVRILPREN